MSIPCRDELSDEEYLERFRNAKPGEIIWQNPDGSKRTKGWLTFCERDQVMICHREDCCCSHFHTATETASPSVSAPLAGEASQSPSPATFEPDLNQIDRAFCLPERRGFMIGSCPPRREEKRRWRMDFLADFLGCACLFFLLFAALFIGELFR